MMLSSRELRRGQLVEMVSGGSRDIGRRFIVQHDADGDVLYLTYATKAGRDDKRQIPWSGWYGDCSWRLIPRVKDRRPQGQDRDGLGLKDESLAAKQDALTLSPISPSSP